MYINAKIVYFWSLTLFFCHDCLGAGLNKLPLIDAKTLNKNSFSVPKDFTLNRNVLLISFGRDMQSAIDDWARELEFLEGSAESFMVYNMPLIPNPGALVRGFINRGFRSLYKDKEVRELVVILYVKAEVIEGFVPREEDRLQPLVLVVDNLGNILGRATGVVSKEKLKIVKSLTLP